MNFAAAVSQAIGPQRQTTTEVVEEQPLARGGAYDDELEGPAVAGRAPHVLDAGAQRLGVAVVGVTCVAFSKAAEARHPSHKRLFEVADRVIDTRGPVGDAAVPAPGVGTPLCPLSGLLNVAAVWALTAATVEALGARGLTPSVYRSVNLADGFAWNDAAEARYRSTGL